MLEPAKISALRKAYGSAFFVFDEAAYVQNLSEVTEAFRAEYGNVKLAYSFKTNYTPRICQLARRSGVLAEVVSEMEYDLALRVGYSGEDIIFNGPIKPRAVLLRAFETGVTVHFDSSAEIDVLQEYLETTRRTDVRCAVRCGFDIAGEQKTRFGISADDESVFEAYDRLFGMSGCVPVGIHCHFSTTGRSLESFEERIRKVITVAKRVFSGRRFEYLDIGGGFFGKMPDELLDRFPCKVPTYDEYARVVAGEMKRAFPKEDVQLILEPGTMVVADTMKFFCEVSHVKYIGDKALVLVQGSIHNIKPGGKSKIFPSMHVISMGQSQSTELSNADICGYTCIEDDVLASGFSGALAAGDFLVFDNVGAYSTMYKPPFIKPQPTVLSQRGDSYAVIKREETFEDIFKTYEFGFDP